MTTRQPAVAGTFYPDDPEVLQGMVRSYLVGEDREYRQQSMGSPKALIVPHAGYMYSGAVAGKAYQHWQHNTVITPIVFLLGPVHYEWTTINVGSYDFFATPFGEIPINTDLCGELARQGVEVTNAPHLREHSLEVQLPFLQKTLGEFSLVPLVCGDIFPQEIATLLSPYWQRPDCLFVISSDLSHFHTYSEALSLDQESLRVIVEQDFENLENIDGCGRLPIQVSMHLAQQTSATILPFAYANSGDITGEKDSVVGYGALGVV